MLNKNLLHYLHPKPCQLVINYFYICYSIQLATQRNGNTAFGLLLILNGLLWYSPSVIALALMFDTVLSLLPAQWLCCVKQVLLYFCLSVCLSVVCLSLCVCLSVSLSVCTKTQPIRN